MPGRNSSGLLVFRLDFLCFVWTSCVSSGLLVFRLDFLCLVWTCAFCLTQGGPPSRQTKLFAVFAGENGICVCVRHARRASSVSPTCLPSQARRADAGREPRSELVLEASLDAAGLALAAVLVFAGAVQELDAHTHPLD